MAIDVGDEIERLRVRLLIIIADDLDDVLDEIEADFALVDWR